jgi:hypothetical protein
VESDILNYDFILGNTCRVQVNALNKIAKAGTMLRATYSCTDEVSALTKKEK